MLQKIEFLQRYCFKEEEFEQTGLDWNVLEQICDLHAANVQDLQTTADYISQRLRRVPEVHSLKMRIKHPEHLLAKIVRKRIDEPAREITRDNYRNSVTDLIGIRALHLFKNQWRPIHEFVTSTWKLKEKPIAYVRDGDPDNVLRSFKECGCKVKKHGFGYRSVHYVIKSQSDRRVQLAELQVRTLFEEGWSEIDHQIRYPRVTDNPHLAEFLTIFNRLAGSADEMGTFIQALSQYLMEQTGKLTQKEIEVEAKEKELKRTIRQLTISEKDKRGLEAQIDKFRQSSSPSAAYPFLPNSFADISRLITETKPWSPNLAGLLTKTCSKCGATFQDDIYSFGIYDMCPTCRKLLF